MFGSNVRSCGKVRLTSHSSCNFGSFALCSSSACFKPVRFFAWAAFAF